MKSEIMQMKIKLNGIKPEIWRRFIVDSSIPLDSFHDILQAIMGWTNSHLYGFSIRGVEYSPAEDDFGMGLDNDAEDTKGVKLNRLHLGEKDNIVYVYDFGDDWNHTIKIEQILGTEDNEQVPYCLEGARNCPPEDCGSIPGYEDLVEAMKNPKSERAKELIEWLGEEYDPEYFDIKGINSLLKQFKKPKAKTKRAGV